MKRGSRTKPPRRANDKVRRSLQPIKILVSSDRKRNSYTSVSPVGLQTTSAEKSTHAVTRRSFELVFHTLLHSVVDTREARGASDLPRNVRGTIVNAWVEAVPRQWQRRLEPPSLPPDMNSWIRPWLNWWNSSSVVFFICNKHVW